MNREGLRQEIAELQKDLKFKQGILTNCMSCDFKVMRSEKEMCVKHGAEIPKEFLYEETCDDWSYDEVPF